MSGLTEGPMDMKLARAVTEALWRSEPIRAMDLDRIQVLARGGVVVLRGIVASQAHSFVAAQLARRVPGVKDVVNELVTDEQLERRVALSLAATERTRDLRLAVNAERGVVTLYGAASNLLDAELARSIAVAVPGVVGVESRIRVLPPGEPVVLAWQNSLEGRPRASNE